MQSYFKNHPKTKISLRSEPHFAGNREIIGQNREIGRDIFAEMSLKKRRYGSLFVRLFSLEFANQKGNMLKIGV